MYNTSGVLVSKTVRGKEGSDRGYVGGQSPASNHTVTRGSADRETAGDVGRGRVRHQIRWWWSLVCCCWAACFITDCPLSTVTARPAKHTRQDTSQWLTGGRRTTPLMLHCMIWTAGTHQQNEDSACKLRKMKFSLALWILKRLCPLKHSVIKLVIVNTQNTLQLTRLQLHLHRWQAKPAGSSYLWYVLHSDKVENKATVTDTKSSDTNVHRQNVCWNMMTALTLLPFLHSWKWLPHLNATVGGKKKKHSEKRKQKQLLFAVNRNLSTEMNEHILKQPLIRKDPKLQAFELKGIDSVQESD